MGMWTSSYIDFQKNNCQFSRSYHYFHVGFLYRLKIYSARIAELVYIKSSPSPSRRQSRLSAFANLGLWIVSLLLLYFCWIALWGELIRIEKSFDNMCCCCFLFVWLIKILIYERTRTWATATATATNNPRRNKEKGSCAVIVIGTSAIGS